MVQSSRYQLTADTLAPGFLGHHGVVEVERCFTCFGIPEHGRPMIGIEYEPFPLLIMSNSQNASLA